MSCKHVSLATLSNLVNCTQILGLILDFSLIMVIQWRTIAGIMVIPPIATMVTMMMAPETPHWLANKGRNEVREILIIALLN